MTDREADPDADLGIKAFQDMSRSMDRLGDTLKAADQRQQTRLSEETAQVSKTRAATAEAKQAADMALNASQKALQAAQIEIRSSLLWTGLTGAGGALAAFLVGFYAGDQSGWDQGVTSGYAKAHDQVAAAAWANTPGGHRAFVIDQLGGLDRITTCSAPGWTIQRQQGHRVCYPSPDKDGQTIGWFIP